MLQGYRNLYDIIAGENDRLVVVVSAFGKTTNALEEVHQAWRSGDSSLQSKCEAIADTIWQSLIGALGTELRGSRHSAGMLSIVLRKPFGIMTQGEFDHDYDMIVSMGEVWSTLIVEAYLRQSGIKDQVARYTESFL